MIETIQNFFSKSIKRNLASGIIITYAILMSLFIYNMTDRQREFLSQQALIQTQSLATTFSKNATSWVLATDYIGLEEIVQSLNNYPHLAYAMILDSQGKVLAHTDDLHINQYLTDPISLQLTSSTEELILVDSSELIDVASPIKYNGKIIGYARVAITQNHIDDEIKTVTYKGLFYTLIAICVGWLFAIFMANKLSQAFLHIIDITKKISSGDWNQRVSIKREDEIGTLISHINAMLDQLQKKEEEIIQINKTLHENEFRWKFAVEGNGDGLWDWNMVTNEVYFSKQWKKMLGFEDDEIQNNLDEWEKRVHPDDIAKTYADIQKHLDGEVEYYQNEHRALCKDGTYKWILDRGVIVDHDINGAPTRMIGTHSDLSETKKLNIQLEDLNKHLEEKVAEQTHELREINKNLEQKVKEQLEQIRISDATLYEQAKLASMGEMIGNIAHQWRQPLSVISTLASGTSFKQEYGSLTPQDIETNMDQIIIQTQYLSKTIDDFRDFIKGNQPKEKIDLKSLIEKTLSIVGASLKNNYIDIITDIQENLIIDGFENELMQAFINIINNSKDAFAINTPENQPRFIFISATKIEDNVEIRIRDNAGGIDESILHRIFEPYFTTKHKFKGTVLGLSMTHKIITELHQGTIEALNVTYDYESQSYNGACIKIVL